jgi:hypothetical protein
MAFVQFRADRGGVMFKRSLGIASTVVVVAVLLASHLAEPVLADYNIKTIGSCMTIDKPWSYTVDQNIQAKEGEGNCLVITTNNVTIDLAGYTITGNGTGNGITTGLCGGINNSCQNITVRNGTVTNFEAGIVLVGDQQVVEQVRAVSNSSTGIEVTGGALGGNAVRDSIASDNGQFGIRVVLGDGHSVIGNLANDNNTQTPSFGIIVNGCPSTVVNNVATGHGTDIFAIGGCTKVGNSPAQSAHDLTATP